MRRLALILASFASLAILLVPAGASATNVLPNSSICSGKAASSAVCQDKTSSKSDPLTGSSGLIIKVTRIIAVAAGIAAVIMIIVGGMRFIFSGGESQAVAGARKTIIFAAVGLVVIALAEVIMEFVVGLI